MSIFKPTIIVDTSKTLKSGKELSKAGILSNVEYCEALERKAQEVKDSNGSLAKLGRQILKQRF